MSGLARAEVVEHLKQLPALPSTVSELLLSFDDEDVDVVRIAHQIGCDQGLSARVLRVANSSFYGLRSRIATLNEAVNILGFRAVRSMVVAVGISGTFKPEGCPGFDLRVYTRHSVAVGLAAHALAKIVRQNAELAFTGGVLHDIGKLVLAACFGPQYAEALSYRAHHDCPMAVAERDVLGMDHAAVGGFLAQAWNFPLSLYGAVAEHHEPSAATANSLADLIHMADAIAHALGVADPSNDLVMPVDRVAWNRLGLDVEKIGEVLAQVLAGMDEACLAFTA